MHTTCGLTIFKAWILSREPTLNFLFGWARHLQNAWNCYNRCMALMPCHASMCLNAQKIQGRMWGGGRQSEIQKTFNKQNSGQHWASEATGESWSSSNGADDFSSARTFLNIWKLNQTRLGKVINGDESLIFECNPETKRQSLQWKSDGSPRPKKVKMSKSKMKLMFIAFFMSVALCTLNFCQGNFAKTDSLSAHQKKRMVWKQWLAASSQQHYIPQCLEYSSVFNQTKCYNARPTSIFTRPIPLRFFQFPKLKSVIKGTHLPDLEAMKRVMKMEI